MNRETDLVIIRAIPGNYDSNDPDNRWGKSGEFPCPKCKLGIVWWKRDIRNGHWHAICSTITCFMGVK